MDTNFNSIVDLLHEACTINPDKTAILENGSHATTYGELWHNACCIAGYIMDCVPESQFVGIEIEKSASYIECLCGCWLASKAFVPMGGSLPKARKDYMQSQADLSLVFTLENYTEAIRHAPADTFPIILPNDPAYIIYSSGTTGKPKGIVVSHAGLPNLAICQKRAFNVTESSCYLFFLSVNFDASISDILVTLTSGATLVIESDTSIDLSAHLLEIIKEREVTHTDIPPVLLRLLNSDECPPSLQTIVIGGEAADVSTVRKWSGIVNLINAYGPTEATVCTSLCRCTAKWSRPLLGKVLDHTEYFVYNDGKLDADEGELWIAGIGLALGYLNNDELTKVKFPVVDGRRYYRTNDYVRRTADGEYEFLGRMDRQVKLHGQLIELEEIEATLRTIPQIAGAAVVKRRETCEDNREIICAFVEKRHPQANEDELKQLIYTHVRHTLPQWMKPGCIMILDKIPQTATGKVDYPELEVMELNLPKDHKQTFAYASDVEKGVAEIMGEILKIPAVASDDNFLELGADSLDCVVLISQLQSKWKLSVTMEDIHTQATPKWLSQIGGSNALCVNSEVLSREWNVTYEAELDNKLRGSSIFMTGATGFLGAHLLTKLLGEYSCSRIYCLVRASDEMEGMQRLEDTFSRLKLDAGRLTEVSVVCGDLTQKNFGIEKSRYAQLAREVKTVFHCAAKVNMMLPYNDLKDVNVQGTRQIMDFCLYGCRKHLHYASTLSVFVATDRNVGVAMENDLLSAPTNIYGGYGQTKYVAEKILLGIPERLCDVSVYRLGLLCGNTKTGKSATKDFLGMFLKGIKKLKTMPLDKAGNLAIDITPVDQAVDVFMDIVRSKAHGIFHIAAEEPLMYSELTRLLLKDGVIDSVCTYGEWQKTTQRVSADADVQAALMSLCRMDAEMFEKLRYMDLFQTTSIRFDMSHTHEYTDRRCRYTEEILDLYIN